MFLWVCVYWLVLIYFVHTLIHSFIHSLIHLYSHSFICIFIRSFTYSFIQSFVYSFVRSIVRFCLYIYCVYFVWFSFQYIVQYVACLHFVLYVVCVLFSMEDQVSVCFPFFFNYVVNFIELIKCTRKRLDSTRMTSFAAATHLRLRETSISLHLYIIYLDEVI